MHWGPRWLTIAGLLFLSILLVINTVLLLHGEHRLTRLETVQSDQTRQLAALQEPGSGKLSDNLEFLNSRVQLLTSVISDMEVKLTYMKKPDESINRGDPEHRADAAPKEIPAVTGTPDDPATQPPAAASLNTELPKDVPSGYEATRQPAPDRENSVSTPLLAQTNDPGSWVINVASLGNQAAAARFSARAHAHGIPVQQQVVTVDGQQRWRIQITGFSSLTEARINAGPIKEKLGLENIWISQR
jgi:SPOR domain